MALLKTITAWKNTQNKHETIHRQYREIMASTVEGSYLIKFSLSL